MRLFLALLVLVVLGACGRDLAPEPEPTLPPGPPPTEVFDHIDDLQAALDKSKARTAALEAEMGSKLAAQARERVVWWQRIAYIAAAVCGAGTAVLIGLAVWQYGNGPWIRLAMATATVGVVCMGIGWLIPHLVWLGVAVVGLILACGVGWLILALKRESKAAQVGVDGMQAVLDRVSSAQAGEFLEHLKQLHEATGVRDDIRRHIAKARS